jgi:hypothetical protein
VEHVLGAVMAAEFKADEAIPDAATDTRQGYG